MKHIKLFEQYNNYTYNIPDKDFLNILNKYLNVDILYNVENDKLYTNNDISLQYNLALRLYNIINKNKVVLSEYSDIYKYTPKQIVGSFGHEGFNNELDAIEYLKEILKAKFPLGYKNMTEKVKLYRVLFVSNIDEINKNKLGTHFITDKNIIDSDWLLSIGGENFDWDETPPHIVEIIVNRDEIDFEYTIRNNLLYPYEYEITMKSINPKIDIINIYKY